MDTFSEGSICLADLAEVLLDAFHVLCGGACLDLLDLAFEVEDGGAGLADFLDGGDEVLEALVEVDDELVDVLLGSVAGALSWSRLASW